LPDIGSGVEDGLLGIVNRVSQITVVALEVKALVALQSSHEAGFGQEWYLFSGQSAH